MELRNEVLRCLRERIQNWSGEKRIFRSREAHMEWIYGTDKDRGGLLSDPQAALSEIIEGPDGSVAHEGISLREGEGTVLLGYLKNLLFGADTEVAGMPKLAPAGDGPLQCTGPGDPDCYY